MRKKLGKTKVEPGLYQIGQEYKDKKQTNSADILQEC